MLMTMDAADFPVELGPSSLHESTHLRLDSSKAKAELGWRPLLSFDDTIGWTARWYRDYVAAPGSARQLTEDQISEYQELIGRNFPREGVTI
jgi:CDP-glucose 4,6-dehydratase